MAVSRLSQQSIQQSFPKGNTLWDGTTATSAFDSLGSVLVPSGGLATITFSNIPQTYTHLQLRSSCLTAGWLTMRFNSNSTTGNYFGHEIRGNGTSATAQSQIGFATN